MFDDLTEIDKLAHGYAGVYAFAGARLTALALGADMQTANVIGVSAAFIAGAIKEHLDPSPDSAVDTLATGLGGVFGLTLTMRF